MHKFTNRLFKETSPYLLQHAHNPVDWHPWSEEALQKAQIEDKPILISIGYSTCHWCHVMERESFENEEVAQFMNEHFINIKVDREERPDLDNIYMEAVQMISGGHGGWPLNCFLLPDGRPFFGGTYFPPVQNHGRASWSMVLKNINNAYQKRRDEVYAQADKVMHYLQESDSYFVGELFDNRNDSDLKIHLTETFETLKNNFDLENGGFGYAPKFPSSSSLNFCLKYYYYSKNSNAIDHVHKSLESMIYGGIYDQIGGGFSRYTVDEKWMIPHFEKMLYDNALLVSLLSESYKLSKKSLYKDCIEETLHWVEREMLHTEGAFYSALDADSEGIEGKYYIWKKSEIDKILGERSELFCEYYNITEEGNWEHHNILHRKYSLIEFADKKSLDRVNLKELFEESKDKLLTERFNRIRPSLDDKIILSWNAMMCTAYLHAYQALGNEHYKEIAIKNIEFCLNHFIDVNDHLRHSFKDGQLGSYAFLDDYALFIETLLVAYQTVFEIKYLIYAQKLTEIVLRDFYDEKDHLYFFSAKNQQDLIYRKKDMYDNAIPSGNSTMIHNLFILGKLLNHKDYDEKAVSGLRNMKKSILKFPQSFSKWAEALFYDLYATKELVIVGEEYLNYIKLVQKNYLPELLYCSSKTGKEPLPLFENREKNDNNTMIYLCSNYTCELPTDDIKSVLNSLISD